MAAIGAHSLPERRERLVMAEKEIIQAALRLPADMHARIKALADSDRRSLHAEILVLLDEAMAAREEREYSDLKIAA